MKRAAKLGVLLSAVICLPVLAEVLDVGGEFSETGRNGLPRGWKYNYYKGYQPFATVAVSPSADGGVMSLTKVVGRSGAAVVTTNRYPAVKGEIVRVSCEVRGRGSVVVGLDHYAEGGRWNKSAEARSVRTLEATGQWRRHEFDLHVGNGAAPTESVSLSVGCRSGDEVSVRNLSAEILHLLQTDGLDFVPARRYYEDTFEQPSARRIADPRIVRGAVSDGLLTQTCRGRYQVYGRTRVAEVDDVPVPAANRYFLGEFRLYEVSSGAELVYLFKIGGNETSVPLPRSVYSLSMPVDVVFHLDIHGGYVFDATSLVDGRRQFHLGTLAGLSRCTGRIGCSLAVVPPNGSATAFAELDNVVFGEDQGVARRRDLPARSVPEREFDPRAKGWKLVFEDGFDGPSGENFDTNKWFISYWDSSTKRFSRKNNALTRLDGNGHLSITADFAPGATNLICGPALQSVPTWCYGYFEARVRFTKNNGWWSAFWLYGSSNAYAAEDGSEIDIFEDYNTHEHRRKGEKAPLALDHNLHASYGSIRDLKSYNRNSRPNGSVDDFHTIGCKWTPFEIAYYLDGKLLENSVTDANPAFVVFDAFHENAVRAPLHVKFSAHIMRSWGNRDLSGCVFPESFLVDWVKVWEYPREDLPCVRWKKTDDRLLRDPGEHIILDVEVEGKDSISEVFLFDNGAFIASRKAPPWRFCVPFTRDFFEDETCYLKPGRQRVKPKWDQILHVFTVYARDEKGRVGTVGDSRWALNAAVEKNAPGVREVQKIPGRVRFGAAASRYIPWFETGKIRSCETEVGVAGKYRLTLSYRSGCDYPNKVVVFVDGASAARIEAPCAPNHDWEADLRSKPVVVCLPAGRHRISLLSIGSICLGDLAVELEGK